MIRDDRWGVGRDVRGEVLEGDELRFGLDLLMFE